MPDRPEPGDAASRALAVAGGLVDARLRALLDAEQTRWQEVDDDVGTPLALLDDFAASGGKRIRPAFAYWTFVGSGGDPNDPRLADLCTALELLHMFALLHDDVMDGSDTRRGLPTVHRSAEAHHVELGWHGEPRRFGEGVAILVGDLAFTYADHLTDGLPVEVLRLYTDLRLELVVGQYLDLESAARGDTDLDRVRRIAIHKSGKYTVERPLQLGATLSSGGRARLEPALSQLGTVLGQAFQLRDDLLGVFGDATVLGKPVGDDLREGKATELLAIARAEADDRERAILERAGDVDLGPTDLAEMRSIIESTGARRAVEERITKLAAAAQTEIAALGVTPEATDALAALADFVAWREY